VFDIQFSKAVLHVPISDILDHCKKKKKARVKLRINNLGLTKNSNIYLELNTSLSMFF